MSVCKTNGRGTEGAEKEKMNGGNVKKIVEEDQKR
jgi:hypothetical protein